VANSWERFGYKLTAGDFNGDGAEDLMVGVPWDIVGTTDDGSVHVLYGSMATQTVVRWHNSATALGGGWYRYAWLGDFALMGGDWIWHNRHGFMYSASTSAADIWFWTQDMGWLWTGSGTAPFFYRLSDGAWIWYQQWSQAPRWFYNFKINSWESRNP
jgi:hypothetical protein